VLLGRQDAPCGAVHQNQSHDQPGRERALHSAGPPWVLLELEGYNVGAGTLQVHPGEWGWVVQRSN
jgi:hypothetical protein